MTRRGTAGREARAVRHAHCPINFRLWSGLRLGLGREYALEEVHQVQSVAKKGLSAAITRRRGSPA